MTDRDASHNGPPFTFAIVDGNEGDAFRISERGALVAVGALKRRAVEHYLLQAQVSHGERASGSLSTAAEKSRGRIDFTSGRSSLMCLCCRANVHVHVHFPSMC